MAGTSEKMGTGEPVNSQKMSAQKKGAKPLPLTPAEKMRRYREKLNLNPNRKQEVLKKDRARKKGKYKPVSEMTPREHRSAKSQWRKSKQKNRTGITSPTCSRQKLQAFSKVTEERDQLKKDIASLSAKLRKEQKKAERYRKMVERVTPTRKETEVPLTPQSKTKRLLRLFNQGTAAEKVSRKKSVSRTLVYHFALTDALKALRGKHRKTLGQLKRSEVLKKYKSNQRLNRDFQLSNPRLYSRKGTVISRNKTLVVEFFLRNDVSTILPGKKNTVTRKGVKKQKRHLTDSLHNLYKKFCAENPGCNMKFVSFYRCKPFWVVRPKDSERKTCMCKICCNMSFLANAMYESKAVDTSVLSVLLHQCVCSVDERSCMYGECEKCIERTVPDLDERDLKDEYTWLEWKVVKEERKFKTGEVKSVKVVRKVQKHGPYDTLKSEFMTMMKIYKKHYYITSKQFEHYAATKRNLQDDEVMIHIDFAENYVGKFASEIQSVHFGASKPQISLHTGFFLARNMKDVQSFCGVSDSLCHEPASIWAYLTHVLQHIRTNMPHIKHIHFFSDGPSTQYKQKNNFYLLSTETFKHGFESVCWNFSAAGHGKGIPDGVGGAVKRSCDQLVKFGTDVLTASTIVQKLTETNSSVMLYEITEKDIAHFKELITNKKLKPLLKTTETHQVVSRHREEVQYRDTSCYCGGTSVQSDSAFRTHNFNQQKHGPCKWASHFSEIPFPDTHIHHKKLSASDCLEKLQDCDSFAELKHECEVQTMYMDELYGAERTCRAASLPCELLYSRFIPSDFKKVVRKSFFPVRVRADGDCLPACGSVFATGKDTNPDLIRLKIVHELAINEDYYLTESNLLKGYSHPTKESELMKAFAMYSDEYMVVPRLDDATIKSIFRKETMSVIKPRAYMGIWQIFALASVLKMPIQSVYPDLGNPRVRRHLNRRVEPRVKVSSDVANIMWTSTRLNLSTLNWVPNHFMPLLSFS